jgi:hypothetical protein
VVRPASFGWEWAVGLAGAALGSWCVLT